MVYSSKQAASSETKSHKKRHSLKNVNIVYLIHKFILAILIVDTRFIVYCFHLLIDAGLHYLNNK